MAEQQALFAKDLKEDQRLHKVAFEKQDADYLAQIEALSETLRTQMAEMQEKFAKELSEDQRVHAEAFEKQE